MVGGHIVQIVGNAVEVVDHTYFDRCWRRVAAIDLARVGDEMWWQGHMGYLSRRGEFRDAPVGRCVACNPFGRESLVAA